MPFADQVKKPYDGDHNDLALSSNSSPSKDENIVQNAVEGLIEDAVEEEVDLQKLLED